MGLTGFNRQRKQALSKAFGIDATLADKLMSYGYSTPESVKKADELPFLSEDELKHLFRNDYEEAPEQATEPEAPEQIETTNELDDEFLALPDDTEFPYKFSGGWHYLSNGEKVNGKANAEKAQSELDGE